MTTRILALTFLALGAMASDPSAAVIDASTAWRQAAIHQDKAALQRYLADDLMYAHASGKTESKAEYIASVTTGPSHYESFKDSATKVTIYNAKTAVLSGFVDVKPAGRPGYRVRTLEVYVEKNGVWQMTAHQSARITQ